MTALDAIRAAAPFSDDDLDYTPEWDYDADEDTAAWRCVACRHPSEQHLSDDSGCDGDCRTCDCPGWLAPDVAAGEAA